MKATFVAVCLLSVGCQAINHTKRNSEADVEAKRYWEKMLTRCGDRYFTGLPPREVWKEYMVTEYKDPSPLLVEGMVTPTDKLNGFEWQGKMSMHFNNVRYSGYGAAEAFYGPPGKGGWSRWLDGGYMEQTLAKINGQWFYGTGNNKLLPAVSYPFIPPVDCAKVSQ